MRTIKRPQGTLQLTDKKSTMPVVDEMLYILIDDGSKHYVLSQDGFTEEQEDQITEFMLMLMRVFDNEKLLWYVVAGDELASMEQENETLFRAVLP